jgi:hypothetical protein
VTAPRAAEGADEARLPSRVRAAVRAGTWLLRALARTWRVREVGRDGWRRLHAAGQPVVLALWHGQMLTMLAHHRDIEAAILISEHRDGEIIARIARAFGQHAVRGSTSRGGSRALLALAGELRRGRSVAVTPDGPRGPRHSFAPGALVAAQRAAAPVIALVAHVDRAWRLRSWDRFEIPKPFARITIAYSDPLDPPAGAARDAAAAVPRFERVMRELADSAARAAGV